MAEVFDGDAGRGALAVLDVERPQQGPLAMLRLGHHLPLSFYSTWRPA